MGVKIGNNLLSFLIISIGFIEFLLYYGYRIFIMEEIDITMTVLYDITYRALAMFFMSSGLIFLGYTVFIVIVASCNTHIDQIQLEV